MKIIIKITLGALLSLLLFAACDKWIDEAQTPNNTLTFEQLCKPGMVAIVRNKTIIDGPLIANIRTLNGEVASSFFLAAGAMSGEIMPSKQPNIILYKQLYEDNITSNSGQSDGIWNSLHNYRARAEELLDVQQRIVGSDVENLEAIRSYARYIGNLHAGYAWQLLGEAFSAKSDSEAGVRINGTLKNHDEIYSQALKYYEAALKEASNEDLKELHPDFKSEFAIRQVKSLQVKLYMHRGQYAEAANIINQSLQPNETVSVMYNSNGSDNGLYAVVGLNALNAQVDSTLIRLLRNEAEKKAIAVKQNKNNNLYLVNLERYSNLIITDYNEMLLIRAELIIRGKMEGDALTAVNTVIATYNPSDIESSSPDMALLAHLRSVYLYLRAESLADLRRVMVQNENQNRWNIRTNQWMPFPETEK